MSEDLIDFWRRYQWQPGQLAVHPDDRAWMQQHWPAPLLEPYLDWPAYLESPRFGSKDSDVHLSHLPAPFWGDLRRASVLIFLKNPGFDNTDYYLESLPGFREAHLHGLASTGDPLLHPFIHLDPRFSWSGSFLWWEQRLRPILDALIADDGLTYQQALQLLSQEIAAVQLFPYRSRDSSRLRYQTRSGGTMPSVAAAQRFLAGRAAAAIAPATNSNAAARKHGDDTAHPQLVLLMRSHAAWLTGVTPAPDNHNFLHGPRLQGVSLHPRFPAGRRLLETVRASLTRRGRER